MKPDEARFHRIHSLALAIAGPGAGIGRIIFVMEGIAELENQAAQGSA